MEVSVASCVVMEALFLVRLKDNLSDVLNCGQHTLTYERLSYAKEVMIYSQKLHA